MKNLLLKKVEKNCVVLVTLLVSSLGNAQIAQRGTATTATSISTTLTINKPTGLTINDLMIVNLAQGNDNTTNPTSSGWTLIDARSLGVSPKRYCAVLYKIATPADVSAASFVFTMGSSTDSAVGAIIAFSGVDTTTPFDIGSGTISVQGNQTGVVATSKITASANTAILMLGQAGGSTPTWASWTTTSPGSLTELFDVQNNSGSLTSIGGAWALKASIGTTGAGGATLSSAEKNGGILLVLRPCITNTITLSSAVGSDVQTKCINTAISNITYITTGATGATISGLPTGVSGAWASNVYTISGTPTASGTFNYTITLTGGCSTTVTKTGTITVNALPTVVSGTAITTCSTAGAVNITAGSSATNYSSVTWTSSGTGIFANVTSLTTCTYTPSAADISAGSVTITLTASNAGCANVTSTKTLTINAVATSVTGTAITTCSTSGAVNITAGSSATNYSSVIWTSLGTGTFANATSLTTCTYTPSAADISVGSVTLTLTTNGNSPCGNVTSTKTVTISSPMIAVAGTAVTTCATAGAVNITAGASATNQTLVTWTSSGTGTFANATSLTTCTYTPSAADISAGSVTITLNTSNAGCANTTSTKTLTITTAATAVAGTNINTCSNIGSVNITAGASATNATTTTWTSSGTGTFTNPTSLTTCTYTQSTADITAGSVTLTLTATNAGCPNVTSTKTVTIFSSPTSVAGTDINVCNASGGVNITAGSSATNQTLVTWTSSGTGAFTNANSLTSCTYNPSAADIIAGSVTLTVTGNSPCANAISTKTLFIYGPTAIAGTTVATCASTTVNITAGSSATNQTLVT